MVEIEPGKDEMRRANNGVGPFVVNGLLRKLHGKGIALRASCACTSCHWNRDLSEGALCAGRSNTALAQIDANSTPTAPAPIILCAEPARCLIDVIFKLVEVSFWH